MNHSESQLRINPRIIPPDLLLRFGYTPRGGIEFDSAAQTLSFYQGGTQRIDVTSFGLAVRNGNGLVIGNAAQVAVQVGTPEFQVLGTTLPDSSGLFSRWTANSAAPSLNFNKSRNAAIGSFTIVQNGDALGTLRFTGDDGVDYKSIAADIIVEVDGTPGVGDMPGRIILKTTVGGAEVSTEALRIDSSQNLQMRNESHLWIGPDSAATGYTPPNTGEDALQVGILINQEAQDGSVLLLKSSDVSIPHTGIAESDTWAWVKKTSALKGGFYLTGITSDGNAAGEEPILLRGISNGEQTGNTTSTSGNVTINALKSNGGTSAQALGATGNVFAIRNGGTTLWLIEGDGDVHTTTVDATNSNSVAATALDDWEDAALVRTLTSLTQKNLIRNKWDDMLKYNEQSLIDAGIIDPVGLVNGALMNQSQLLRLYGGAIWQGYSAHMGLVERVDSLAIELTEAKQQLAALTA